MNRYLSDHPNIWNFIDEIKAEESVSSFTLIRVEKDIHENRGRNFVDLQRDLDIQVYKCEYLSGKYDIMQYLTNVSNCVCDDKAS